MPTHATGTHDQWLAVRLEPLGARAAASRLPVGVTRDVRRESLAWMSGARLTRHADAAAHAGIGPSHTSYDMPVRHFLVGAALLAIGSRALPAQQVTPVFGISAGSLSIESASAARSQVGDRSYGLQLDAGALVKRHLYLGIDVGGQFLDDHAQFTQNTTGGKMKSSASVTYLSAIAGARTGALPVVPLALGLNVGASATISRRSIDQCADCQVDKLDIPGGAFVEPALLLGRRRVRVRMADRVYLAGDGMRSVMSLGAELQLGRR